MKLAEDLRHRRRLLEQWTVCDRKVATDHSAVAIHQAMWEAVDMLRKHPGMWRRSVDCRGRGHRPIVAEVGRGEQRDRLRSSESKTTTNRYVGLRPSRDIRCPRKLTADFIEPSRQ